MSRYPTLADRMDRVFHAGVATGFALGSLFGSTIALVIVGWLL